MYFAAVTTFRQLQPRGSPARAFPVALSLRLVALVTALPQVVHGVSVLVHEQGWSGRLDTAVQIVPRAGIKNFAD